VSIKPGQVLLVLVTIAVVACAGAFWWKYLRYSYETQRETLAPGVELVRKYETRPQIPFGRDRNVVEQTLQAQGKTLWSGGLRGVGDLGVNFQPSPDGRFVAFEHWLHSKPIRIVNVSSGRTFTIPAPGPLPERDNHYYVYPFDLVSWSEESDAITVRVTGTCVNDEREFLGYRELWTVDVATLKATRTKRDEKPWSEDLTWE
jgi:hypothetical protein